MFNSPFVRDLLATPCSYALSPPLPEDPSSSLTSAYPVLPKDFPQFGVFRYSMTNGRMLAELFQRADVGENLPDHQFHLYPRRNETAC